MTSAVRVAILVCTSLLFGLTACQSGAPIAVDPTRDASATVPAPVGTAAPALGIDLRVPPTRAPRAAASSPALPVRSPEAVASPSPAQP